MASYFRTIFGFGPTSHHNRARSASASTGSGVSLGPTMTSNSNSLSSTFSHRTEMVVPQAPPLHTYPTIPTRTRSTSTPGVPTIPTNTSNTSHLNMVQQQQRRRDVDPQMREVGNRNVTFSGHPRSRSIPRPSIVPTEAHRQAYAQQMQSQQAYGTTQVQYDTRPRHPSQPNPADSVPSSRSRSQSQALRSSHRSRSASAHPQSASSTAHMLQGSVTHMSQGTDTRHERQSDERRYRLRDREDLSNSVPSLVSDSAPPTTSAPTSTSTTPTRPSRLARPSTASAAPAAAPTTRGRTGRNRYEVSRTDSGSRHIRTHSVDGTSSGRNSGSGEGPFGFFSSFAPFGRPSGDAESTRERFVPPAPENYNNEQSRSQSQTRGRGSTAAGRLHVVNRFFPNRGPAPTIPQHHHSASLPPSRPTAAPGPAPTAPFIPPLPPRTESLPRLLRPRKGLIHHVSFVNPHTAPKLHIHPLFATTRNAPNPAPILYDVTLPPSRNSVRSRIDGSTNASSSSSKKPPSDPVPTHTLSQPATDPPTYGSLKLYSERFPWVITARGGCAASPTAQSDREIVTNADVLEAVYHTLNLHVLSEEWKTLPKERVGRSASQPPGSSSSTSTNAAAYANPGFFSPAALSHLRLCQRYVARAYDARMEREQLRAQRARAQASLKAGKRVDGELDVGNGEGECGVVQGVRRVDWLMGRTRLVGILVEGGEGRDGDGVVGVAQLVFEKP